MSWTITPRFTQWTPALITTALWLDANDSATVIQSGGAVTSWSDKSGNNRTATAFGNPTYSSTGLSTSKPAVQLDGTGDYLRSSVSAINSSTSFQLFTVFQTTLAAASNTATERLFQFGETANSTGRAVVIGSTTGIIASETIAYSRQTTSTDIVAGSSTYSRSANQAQIFGTVLASSGAALRTNGSSTSLNLGTSTSDFSPSVTGFTANSNVLFGAHLDSGVIYTGFAMKFSEIILIDAYFDLLTTQRIEGYLAHKWGLTANLPSDHPYKVNAPAP
jgi:hypothetical protein